MTCVIDTNVILVANDAHDDVSPECVIRCVEELTTIMRNGCIAIDDAFRILREYQNKTAPHRGKGVGDVFVKWVLSNLGRPERVHQVALQELETDVFVEFPAEDLVDQFDPPDRKFAAVAHCHPQKPPIYQASDCKWADWWPRLAECGIQVVFLCGDDIGRFYKQKFPGKGTPRLP